jgi:biopolymer transport protein ExbB
MQPPFLNSLGISIPVRHAIGLLALVGVFALAGATPARAWWDGDWQLRKLITIDTTSTGKPINDPIGTAPILIRLHDGDFRFNYAKSDGSDLRFIAADDKTPLPYHIEKFDSLLDEAFVWVKVPDLKPGARTSFWLYYGNGGPKAVKVESARDTYDPDTVLVYHFGERSQPCFDSSGHGNNSENPGAAAEGSLIGSGLRLDGKTVVNLPSSPSLAWLEGADLTWSAWIKFGMPQSNAILFSRRDGDDYFLIGADGDVPFFAVSNRGSAMRSSAGAPVGAGWHHIAVVQSVGRTTLYVDGDVYGSAASTIPNLNGSAQLGGDGSVANSGAGFVGEIDELEISKVARSAGYLKLAADEQGPDAGAKILVVGDDEQPTSIFGFLKKGYIGVIISSLTPDGWAVIALLGVMALISWYVMISKAVYLNRVGKGNAEFIREWRNVSMDLSIFDEVQKPAAEPAKGAPEGGRSNRRRRNGGGARNSPIFHIYQIGIEEVRHRLAAEHSGGGVAVISARSIEAIRASLDGGFVRESQRLNSLMVLLTIAISGGPFLGLLGTVIGVMITFAAVAQAGDVNVNAIAPGIAAALAATVAGLGVAIPSLFGYNYLLTRIKMTTSDMQVFIDEFVTRLAEFYEG